MRGTLATVFFVVVLAAGQFILVVALGPTLDSGLSFIMVLFSLLFASRIYFFFQSFLFTFLSSNVQ